jgi:hypothetical protein
LEEETTMKEELKHEVGFPKEESDEEAIKKEAMKKEAIKKEESSQ